MTDTDLMEIPTFADLYNSADGLCPAFRAFADDVAVLWKSEMWALWEAAGEPDGKSPISYLAEFREPYGRRVSFVPDGRLLADHNVALHYLEWADELVREVAAAMRMRASRTSPAGLLMLSPDPVTAALAIDATMKREGCGIVEARDAIRRELEEMPADTGGSWTRRRANEARKWLDGPYED